MLIWHSQQFRIEQEKCLHPRNDWLQQSKSTVKIPMVKFQHLCTTKKSIMQKSPDRKDRHEYTFTCSSSWRSRWSWDSNCLLWSSKICILASRRPLCCLRSLASAMSSASSGACWGETMESGGDARGLIPLRRCCSFSCSYSICRLLVYWRQEWWCK